MSVKSVTSTLIQ